MWCAKEGGKPDLTTLELRHIHCAIGTAEELKPILPAATESFEKLRNETVRDANVHRMLRGMYAPWREKGKKFTEEDALLVPGIKDHSAPGGSWDAVRLRNYYESSLRCYYPSFKEHQKAAALDYDSEDEEGEGDDTEGFIDDDSGMELSPSDELGPMFEVKFTSRDAVSALTFSEKQRMMNCVVLLNGCTSRKVEPFKEYPALVDAIQTKRLGLAVYKVGTTVLPKLNTSQRTRNEVLKLIEGHGEIISEANPLSISFLPAGKMRKSRSGNWYMDWVQWDEIKVKPRGPERGLVKAHEWEAKDTVLRQDFDNHAEAGTLDESGLKSLLTHEGRCKLRRYDKSSKTVLETEEDYARVLREFGTGARLDFDGFMKFRASRELTVYPEQERYAYKLFDKISEAFGSENAVGLKPLEDFSKFDVFILVPNLNNILKQTVIRLREFFDAYGSKPGCKHFFAEYKTANDPRKTKEEREADAEAKIERRLIGKKNNAQEQLKQFAMVQKKVEAHPDTFFLILHDEAHYETGYKRAADLFFNGDAQQLLSERRGSTFAECVAPKVPLSRAPNVAIVNVSATPFILVTKQSRIPKDHEVQWDESPGYVGQNEYCSLDKYDSANPGTFNGCDKAFDDRVAGLRASHYNEEPDKKKTTTEEGDQEREVGKGGKWAMAHTLVEEFTRALEKTRDDADGKFPDQSRYTHTEQMVRDLVNIPLESADGSGIMILIRQATANGGLKITEKIRAARDALGLQGRFAVIVDLEEAKSSLLGTMEDHNSEMLDLMKRRNRSSGKDVVLSTYEDLEGLPCILILCDKGKMGDSFPKSLRHYDMRCRYPTSVTSRGATVQDLGRAFGYRSPEHAPMTAVGKACMTQLKEKRTGGGTGAGSRRPRGLLGIPPDYRQKVTLASNAATAPVRSSGSFRGTTESYPSAEFDTLAYRDYWDPVDSGEGKAIIDWRGMETSEFHGESWKDDPRQFLLFGRPQIGKTGAFLYLIYLCWKECSAQKVSDPEPPDDESDDDDDDVIAEDMDEGKYPDAEKLRKHSFGHVRAASSLEMKQRIVSANTSSKPFTATAKFRNNTGPNEAQLSKWTGEKYEVKFSETECSEFSWSVPNAVGYLHIVDAENGGQMWSRSPRTSDGHGSTPVVLHLPDSKSSLIRFPIFTPSFGQHAHGNDQARLDISNGMRANGEVLDYAQIVVVSATEVDDYKRSFPEHTFFELPDMSDTFGFNGFSLFYMKQLAHIICPPGFPFCAVLDCNIDFWKRVLVGKKDRESAKKASWIDRWEKDIRQGTVLDHWQKSGAGGFTDMDKFAIIGFENFNGRKGRNKLPYARRHVFSACVLNLARLVKVDYDPTQHFEADVKFNMDVNKLGDDGLICKCARYQYYKPSRPQDSAIRTMTGEMKYSQRLMEQRRKDLHKFAPPEEVAKSRIGKQLLCPGNNFKVVDRLLEQSECQDFCFVRAVFREQEGKHRPNKSSYSVQDLSSDSKCATFGAGDSKHFGQYGQMVTHFLAVPTSAATSIKTSMYGDRLFRFNKNVFSDYVPKIRFYMLCTRVFWKNFCFEVNYVFIGTTSQRSDLTELESIDDLMKYWAKPTLTHHTTVDVMFDLASMKLMCEGDTTVKHWGRALRNAGQSTQMTEDPPAGANDNDLAQLLKGQMDDYPDSRRGGKAGGGEADGGKGGGGGGGGGADDGGTGDGGGAVGVDHLELLRSKLSAAQQELEARQSTLAECVKREAHDRQAKEDAFEASEAEMRVLQQHLDAKEKGLSSLSAFLQEVERKGVEAIQEQIRQMKQTQENTQSQAGGQSAEVTQKTKELEDSKSKVAALSDKLQQADGLAAKIREIQQELHALAHGV